MFEVLETEKIVEGEADLTLIPARNELLAQLMAAAEPHPRTPTKPPTPKSAPCPRQEIPSGRPARLPRIQFGGPPQPRCIGPRHPDRNAPVPARRGQCSLGAPATPGPSLK